MQSIILLSSLFLSSALASPIANAQPQGFDQMGAVSATFSNRSPNRFSKRQNDYSDTRNELSECKPVTVIFARGTIEAGNVGSLAGPPFFNALDVAIGAENVAVQGVDYPATIGGYLEGGDPGGAATTAQLLEQAASQCPDTQIVLSGYSQGAQEVHLGEAMVSAEVAARIAAVVSKLNPPILMKKRLIRSDRLYSAIPSKADLSPTLTKARSTLSASLWT